MDLDHEGMALVLDRLLDLELMVDLSLSLSLP